MRYRLLIGAVLAAGVIGLGGLTHAVQAQNPRRPGDVGVGGQVGDPSGVTLRLYGHARFVYDVLGAWDLDRFFFLNVHGLIEHPFESSDLNVFYGPGLLLGVEEHRRDEEVVLGISANVGVNYYVERFEVYVQLTPRIHLVPDTRGNVGGGIGLRYYF